MNNNTRNEFAAYGLEILKRAVLLVLYQQPLDSTGEHRETLTQKEICEQLDIPRHLYGKNRLIPGILDLLEADKYVYGFIGGHWRITEKGVSVIEV